MQTVLHLAAANGNSNITELLIKNGANVDNVDKNGNTALHVCSLGGYSEVARVLLKMNANRDIRNLSDLTPLLIAAEVGNFEMVILLMKTTTDAEPAIAIAAAQGHISLIEKLLEKKRSRY